MIDLSKFRGATAETLPSGNIRIRVRVEGNPSEKITIPDGLSDDDFREAYAAARRGVSTNYRPMRLFKMQRQPGFLATIYNILSRAKQRAQKKGLHFDLTPDDVMELLDEQDGRCAVSGMLFDISPHPRKGAKRPFCMSLDRIDNEGGYTRDNIRVTTVIVNMSRLNWTDDAFIKMCVEVARNRKKSPTTDLKPANVGHVTSQDAENKEENRAA